MHILYQESPDKKLLSPSKKKKFIIQELKKYQNYWRKAKKYNKKSLTDGEATRHHLIDQESIYIDVVVDACIQEYNKHDNDTEQRILWRKILHLLYLSQRICRENKMIEEKTDIPLYELQKFSLISDIDVATSIQNIIDRINTKPFRKKVSTYAGLTLTSVLTLCAIETDKSSHSYEIAHNQIEITHPKPEDCSGPFFCTPE